MEKKNKIIIIAIVLALAVLFSGLTYAYFTSATSSESGSTIVAKGGTMNIVYENKSANIIVSNIYPREEAWVNKEFTVTGNNTTDLEMEYRIYLVTSSNGFNLGDLTYSLSGTSTNNDDFLSSKENQVIPKSGELLIGTGTFKSKNATHSYNLSIFYKDNGETQNNGQGKNYTGYVQINNGNTVAYDALIYSKSYNNNALAFNGPITKQQVQSINFKDNTLVPDNAIASWDASKKQNGSIMAYTLDEDNDGLYELYIGQNEKVVLDSDAYRLFWRFNKLQTLDLNNLDTSHVTNMEGMFLECQATSLNLSSFDTSRVTNMSRMFEESQATTINLSSFDTSKVTKMDSMFQQSQATTLDLSSFDTSNVTDMSGMFNVSYATTLDLSNFDTSKVTNMSGMFMSSKATTINLNSFNTSNVTNMSGMFLRSKATTLDLSKFDTSNVTDMSEMFANSKVTTLDLSNFDTSNVTDMSEMFENSKDTTLDLRNFDTSKVTRMDSMFAGSQATTLNLSSFDTSNVTNMAYMFSGSKVTALDLSNFDTSKVTNMRDMFRNIQDIKLDLSNFDTSNVTNMIYMFWGSKITTLDLSNFDTSNVTDMYYMFKDSSATEIKGLDKFVTSKVTRMDSMFAGSQATTLDLSNFDITNVFSMSGMFKNMKNIKILDLSSFDTSKLNQTYNKDIFSGNSATVGYARTQADSDFFNSTTNKPSSLTFTVKQ